MMAKFEFNRVSITGRLGIDPEVRTLNDGNMVCNFSIASTDSWKDKNTGEYNNVTHWFKIVIFDQRSITFCQNYLSKGDKVFVEGKLSTRKIEAQSSNTGKPIYITEIVVRPFGNGQIMLISKKGEGGSVEGDTDGDYNVGSFNEDTEIPF